MIDPPPAFIIWGMANFEAKYEGRQVRIGRPWHDQEGQPGVENVEKWPSEQLAALVEKVGAAVGQNLGSAADVWSWSSQTPVKPGGVLDEDGFVHFQGKPASGEVSAEPSGNGWAGVPPIPPQFGAILSEFLSGLIAATQKDWGLQQAADEG